MVLVFSALGVEKEALAALGGLGNIGMSDIIGLLVTQVGRQVVVFQRRVTQREVLLGEDQTPTTMSALVHLWRERTVLLETGTLIVQDALIDGFRSNQLLAVANFLLLDGVDSVGSGGGSGYCLACWGNLMSSRRGFRGLGLCGCCGSCRSVLDRLLNLGHDG